MSKEMNELMEIVEKFANCGWDVIDGPSKAWLKSTEELIRAIEEADESCGNCGCEFDPLYKKSLTLLRTN